MKVDFKKYSATLSACNTDDKFILPFTLLNQKTLLLGLITRVEANKCQYGVNTD